MSVELYSVSGNDASAQGTLVGGSKPLHRFLKGQPKAIGVVLMILGSSFFIVSIAIMGISYQHIWTIVPRGFFVGTLFVVCGILYVVAEHNPTKKTVTLSLALSIVSILVSCWTILQLAPSIAYRHYDFHDFIEDNGTEIVMSKDEWSSYSQAMGVSIEAIYLFYSIVGAVIAIVMSTLAGAALRSTKSQAIVVMSSATTETPVE